MTQDDEKAVWQDVADRMWQVYELRKSGLTLQQVADELGLTLHMVRQDFISVHHRVRFEQQRREGKP